MGMEAQVRCSRRTGSPDPAQASWLCSPEIPRLSLFGVGRDIVLILNSRPGGTIETRRAHTL